MFRLKSYLSLHLPWAFVIAFCIIPWSVLAIAAFSDLSTGYVLWRDTILFNLPFIGAAGIAYWRSKNTRDVWTWRLFAVGMLFYTAGNLLYDYISSTQTAFPVYAPDLLYLAFFPCVFLGVALMIRTRMGEQHPSIMLDGAITVLALAGISIGLFLGPVMQSTGGDMMTVILNIAYPVADLALILIIIAATVILKYGMDRSWVLLALSFLVYTLGDIAFLYQTSAGAYSEGTWLDLTWTGAACLLAIAGLYKWKQRKNSALGDLAIMGFPIGSGIAALVFLCWERVSGQTSHPIADVLLIMALSLVLVRTFVSYREAKGMNAVQLESLTDDVTGLGNRRAFEKSIEEAMSQSWLALEGEFALIAIDLDDFKRVNDVLGHDLGDMVLHEVGRRIDNVIGEADYAARNGGDEFSVIIAGDEAEARRAAMRLHETLCSEYNFPNLANISIGASIGVALYPRDGEHLRRLADNAMYIAKAEGGGVHVHAPFDSKVIGLTQAQAMTDLQAALKRDNELQLYYQPIVASRGNELPVMEALARWDHPQEGMLGPDKFIPLAEQSGVMQQLNWYVLRRAIKDCARMHKSGREYAVSVNLSASGLLDPRLSTTIAEELEHWGLAGRYLRLELTETMVITDPKKARKAVNQLRDLGVRVLIDDYGTGYSSISHLHDLDLDGIKLDKIFIQQIHEGSEQAKAIVKAIVEMAHAMDLVVVAEGVETEQSARDLTLLGCDYLQGYYISRPVPYESLQAWSDEMEEAA